MTDAGQQLAALSRWIDSHPANTARDPEAQLWGRVSKVSEETGEAIAALIGATGQNPRKGTTHSLEDVVSELLDVAVTALCAVEHLRGNTGGSLAELHTMIDRTVRRAGLATG